MKLTVGVTTWLLSLHSVLGRVGAPVRTSSGLIEGHAAARRPSVSEYLGIPYAVSPTGDLRFAPPVVYSANDTIRAAEYVSMDRDCPGIVGTTPDYPGFTPQAPRIFKSFAQQLNTPQSEDCLHLNVWIRPSDARKPVLLFIHGGRFSLGGAHSPYYDGQALADEKDVVVVTFNYRLNIFGFSGAPGFPQNVGLLDQRMAVEWVHRNIAAFGGDPNRITIFGQSVGGSSVDYYSYAWTEKPLVNGLISHSGTALSFEPNSANLSASYFFHVSKTLDCGDAQTETEKVVQCIRHKPFQEILKAVAKVPPADSPTLPQPVFHPTVDGVTVFDDYPARSAAGQFIHIPYLFTMTDRESGYYRINAFTANISRSDAVWDRFNLAAFTCSTGQAAADRVSHGVPTWHSRYLGDWPSQRLYPTSWAYHGSDLPLLFGTTEEVTGLPPSVNQHRFSMYMMSAWVAFVADPHEGLSRLGWPRYEPGAKTLIGLAHNNGATARLFEPEEFQKDCASLNGTYPGKGAF